MSTFLLTGSQTVGPFFSPALLREDARRNVLTKPETAGEIPPVPVTVSAKPVTERTTREIAKPNNLEFIGLRSSSTTSLLLSPSASGNGSFELRET